MMKMTGQVPDCKPDTFSPKEGYEEKSFDELQKQYDEVPSAPEKPHGKPFLLFLTALF